MDLKNPQLNPGDRDPLDGALRSIGDYLPAVLAEMQRPVLVLRVIDGFDILDPAQPGFAYELDDEILRDAHTAMSWIRQLGEKSWVTKQHLVDLAQAVIDHMESEGGRRR